MKKAIFFMCDQYADWEGAYLASQFNQAADWQVITASLIPVVNSIGGFQTKVNTILPDILLDANVLILIGGNSWQHDYPSLTKLISRTYYKSASWVLSVAR